eukprot:3725230-Pyramimonas_sp.AAC.1
MELGMQVCSLRIPCARTTSRSQLRGSSSRETSTSRPSRAVRGFAQRSKQGTTQRGNRLLCRALSSDPRDSLFGDSMFGDSTFDRTFAE